MSEHLEDGKLLRFMDGESDADERAAVEQHARACPVCTSRLAELRRLSDTITAALKAGDSAPPPFVARPESRRLRGAGRHATALSAAAVVLLVVTAIAAAQPIRTWLHHRWAELRGASPVPPAAMSPPQTSRPTTVRFVPHAPLFTVELTNRPAGGVLTVSVSEDSTATAFLSGGSGEELVILPAGLRIVNHASTVANYELRLPRAIREVAVNVGSAPPRRLVLLTDRQWTVNLNSTSVETH